MTTTLRTTPLALLRSRSYLLLWSAQLASTLGDFFNYIAMAWFVLRLTNSGLALGGVLTAMAAPRAAFMIAGGVMIDRFSPRLVMLSAAFARGVIMAAVTAVAVSGHAQLWMLIVAAVFVGTIAGFFLPAQSSMLPSIVEGDQLVAGNSLIMFSQQAAGVFGPALGGLVVAFVGAGAAFGVDAAGFLAAGLLAMLLPAGATVPSGENPLRQIWDGLVTVGRDLPLVSVLVVIAVFALFGNAGVEVGIPALAHQRFVNGAVALGLLFAAWGLGSAAGAVAVGMLPRPRRVGVVIAGAAALIGVGLAVTGVVGNLIALIVTMAICGIAGGVLSTYGISWVQQRAEPAMLGRVMSLAMFAISGTEPIGLAMAGGFVQHSLGLLFWICAVAIVATAGGALLVPAVRRM
ncbi:MAG: MFS transporter [Candidatus Dormiibacterota bacterium]